MILVFIFCLGGWAARQCEIHLGRKDPGQVVIDELLGQWTSLVFLSQAGVWSLLLAFGLFRILDVLKPWPIRASERWLPGGFGVMIDDLLAGIMAAVFLFFIQ